MYTKDGPRLLEYNVRFGDPEAQVVLPALQSNLSTVVQNCIKGSLDKISMSISSQSYACVVLAAKGYPLEYPKGMEINGLDHINQDILVFHAGTSWQGDSLLTNGGRVLNLVGSGDDIKTALQKTYQACEKVSFNNMTYRRDIGCRENNL